MSTDSGFGQATGLVGAAGYPTAADLEAFLAEAGLTADVDYTDAINAAIDWWEGTTGWYPFLADAVDETVRFDPPKGGYIDFAWSNGPGGFVGVTSIATGVQDGAVGVTQSEWSDYYLSYHRNRTTVTGVEFRRWFGGAPRSVQVVGDAGFCLTLPDDVSRAILQHAAAELEPLLSILATVTDSAAGMGVIEWQEGDVREKLAPGGAFSAQGQIWRTLSDMVANRSQYRRQRVS